MIDYLRNIRFVHGQYSRHVFEVKANGSRCPTVLQSHNTKSTFIQCSNSCVLASLWPRAVDNNSGVLKKEHPCFATRSQRSRSNAICNVSSTGPAFFTRLPAKQSGGLHEIPATHPLIKSIDIDVCIRGFIKAYSSISIDTGAGAVKDAGHRTKFRGFGLYLLSGMIIRKIQ